MNNASSEADFKDIWTKTHQKHLSLGSANLMPKASRQPRKRDKNVYLQLHFTKYMAPKPKL